MKMKKKKKRKEEMHQEQHGSTGDLKNYPQLIVKDFHLPEI